MESKSRKSQYKRILLKVSGEALMGKGNYGIDPNMTDQVAREVKNVYDTGTELALVIGGGNIFRGLSSEASSIERPTADYMGMLATVMNALAMQSSLEQLGIETRVISAIPMTAICEQYIRRRAIRHLEKGRIVIFSAGTGNPFFTTDTAAALRAAEMGCDALLKGTQVDGVYDCDPRKYSKASRYDKLSYMDVISRNLRVMDMSAVTLMKENNIPIIVFSIHNKGEFRDVLNDEGTCTRICE